MEIEPTGQPSWGPAGKPLVENPVKVTLDIPVYYYEDDGTLSPNASVFCGQAFADTVLAQYSQILQGYNFALVHLGFYNPRQARHKDGSLIQPVRWSNHAYGEAVDFKGVVTANGDGEFLGIPEMKEQCPDKLAALTSACKQAISAIQRKPEIVDEGDWCHIDLWPKKTQA